MATILIVDDHALNRAFLMTLLGYSAHRLLEAADGNEGLIMAQKERPDLIISDILMPNMDGHEFVMRMRTDPVLADTPVIFYTAGYHQAEARVIARACGVSHVLAKPAEPELILRTVQDILGLPNQMPTLPALTAPPSEGSRFTTVDNQLAEYLVELESSQTLLAHLIATPGFVDPNAPQRENAIQRLSASLVKLQSAAMRMSTLAEVSQEVAAEVADSARREQQSSGAMTTYDGDSELMEGPRISNERARFQARLARTLQNCGYAHDSPTVLAREFNFRFSGRPVTIHAARKWLVGESIPTQDKLRILAQWLGVTAEWLRFGDAAQDAGITLRETTSPNSDEGRLLANLLELDPYHRRLAHDFVKMLAQKSAPQGPNASRPGKPGRRGERLNLD